MAKDLENKSDKRPDAPADANAGAPAAKGEFTVVRLELRRAINEMPIGTPVAEVVLGPGISLNLMVDAVRNGFCKEVEPPKSK